MKNERKTTKKRFYQSGFTLLEIMIVVVIIGVIAGFAIVNLMGVKDEASIKLAKSFAKGTFATAIGLYQMQTSSYPSSIDDMLKPTASGKEPVLKERPIDPWGEPFQYKYPGIHNPNSFDVYSKGPDKVDGTPDDVGNWADTPTP